MDIFVGSLSFKTTEEELRKQFEAFGEVGSCKIILDQATHKSRGFAFVSMPNHDEATAAIAALNGKTIDGFALKVNEARPREPRGSAPPRSYGNTDSRGGAPGGVSRGRGFQPDYSRDLDIYDTKGSRRGGQHGKKGKNPEGRGRSGGGKHSY